MDSTAFLEAYNQLNKAQKEAVDTIEGPVMVIAGPGTGKTQILTLRIANILKKTDIGPENILALTFTESGARAMRERLASYIGAPAYRAGIYTFHEFAGILIRTYPDAYDRAVGGRPISDLEKISLIESILETPTFKLLRPRGNPQFYVPHIMSALSLMKREYITPEKFTAIIDAQEIVLNQTQKLHEKGAHKGKVRSEYIDLEKSIGKNQELLALFRMYESVLAEKHYFDYDDMIFETVHALLTHEDMLRSLQERYQYILADEHQDVNGSQNKILELLASFHDRPNIFVVGDEKQSIYRFQGASLENFLYFDEKFPHAKTIALTQNYRSSQGILDLAHALITVHEGPAMELRVPLTANREEKAIIERRFFSHEAVEHSWMVQKIFALITQGVVAEEIVVIVRTNREVEDIATHLRKQDISVEASADGDILSHPITTSIRALIKAIVEPSNEQSLFEVLQSSYVRIPPEDLVRIMRNRSYAQPLTMILRDMTLLASIGVSDVSAIQKISNMFQVARERMQSETPHHVLEYVIQESGFLDFVMATDPHEGGRVIRRIYDEIEELVRHGEAKTLRDVERMFATCIDHDIALNAPYIALHRHAVHVMTAHKAKGLEFMHVFVPHLTDQKWGGRTRPTYFDIPVTAHVDADSFDSEDDERKLLYVAITRAKVALYLSNAATNAEGKALLPTRLLEEVKDEHIDMVDTREDEATFDIHDVLLHSGPVIGISPEILKEILKDRGLSATALNNYLRDPWDYFYRNIIRIPEVQSESAQFGTALHDTLRSVMLHRREHGVLPTTSVLKTYLERELGKMPITDLEYTRHHERGFVALTNYLSYIEKALPHTTKEEYRIEATLNTGDSDFPQITLHGMLDRLDFDEEGRLLRVVDYKSGKPKTRGYIEGKTKDSNGDYKRQLTFYALLLSLQDDERLRTREGLLTFIEADEKGIIHEEAYVITDEEIEVLKQDIIRVVHEITQGTFLHVPCDPLKSSYCDLVTQLQKRT